MIVLDEWADREISEQTLREVDVLLQQIAVFNKLNDIACIEMSTPGDKD